MAGESAWRPTERTRRSWGVAKFSWGQAAKFQYASHWIAFRMRTKLATGRPFFLSHRAPRAFRRNPNVIAWPSTTPRPLARSSR